MVFGISLEDEPYLRFILKARLLQNIKVINFNLTVSDYMHYLKEVSGSWFSSYSEIDES